MTRTRLENSGWGPGHTCFVCQPENDHGLGVPFYLDDELERVVAEFTPGVWHGGPPNLAHDGYALALLSEAMSWAVIALARRWGVTRNVQSVFNRPLRLGQAFSVRAWVEGSTGRDIAVVAEIRDSRDRVCVAGRGDVYAMTDDEAEAVFGSASQRQGRG